MNYVLKSTCFFFAFFFFLNFKLSMIKVLRCSFNFSQQHLILKRLMMKCCFSILYSFPVFLNSIYSHLYLHFSFSARESSFGT